MQILAEIANAHILSVTPTVYAAPVWRYSLWNNYQRHLPFMAESDPDFPSEVIKLGGVMVDYIPYNNAGVLQACFDNPKTFFVEGGTLYVHFRDHVPAWNIMNIRSGVLMCFTDNKPITLDGIPYRPGLLSSPVVEQSADAFTYTRMKFNTADITIDNSKGQFDDAGNFFGIECNLLACMAPEEDKDNPWRRVKRLAEAENKQLAAVKNTDEYITPIGKEKAEREPKVWKLAQYYIANITAGLETATFHLKDKRERLSAKIPNEQYTLEKYEYLEEKYIDKDMQEAYGYCYGVPGVCIEGTRIYINKAYTAKEYVKEYRFRFSSQISRIDRIQVKMTDGEIPENKNEPSGKKKKIDGWTTVYQRVRPESEDSPDYWPSIEIWSPNGHWKPGTDEYNGLFDPFESLADGVIKLAVKVAKKKGDYDSDMNEVRMDGVFNDPCGRIEKKELVTPLDIITDIMYKYANVPYGKQWYYTSEGKNIPEIETELNQLNGYEIGVLFDKAVLIYEAIEQLQGGSVYGFQFGVYEELYTARLDDPRRPASRVIHGKDILHLDEVEIDWNAELYGSYTDIEYAYNYDMGNGKHIIDKSESDDILAIHQQEKDWSVTTLLADEDGANAKSAVLLDDFKKLRPLINNIRLSGEKWFGLRVYDMVEIDFRLPGEEREKYPRHLIRLISEVGKERTRVIAMGQTDEYVTLLNDKKETTGRREFAGNLLCQIMRVELDTSTGVTTIDVRVKGKVDSPSAE